MPENDQTETPETPAEGTETPPEGTETPDPVADPETPAEGEGEPKEAELPEWVQKELKKVRSEAAGYRTRLREAETKLDGAKTPEEFEAAVTELKSANAALERNLLVTNVARKYELPEALAARLQGNDEASLEADAKALAALVVPNTSPGSLGGGLTPGESDDEFDPVAAANAARSRRY